MIGQTISHYRIAAKLGQGGMGEVYLAEDLNLERQIALKFLPRHFSNDPEARSRFQREAKALAALNHPNIVAVYEVGEHDGQPFIAMEYVEGRTLKHKIAGGDVSVATALDVIAQVAEGLSAAHKRDIVHRDIKSENIVHSTDGRVKLMDFGLATWRGVTKLTAENSTLGTRAYMSPEQSLGQQIDHRTDLWSLGVVLYELVTGRLPFVGEHDSAIAYSISNETPEPLARYKADVSPELQRIISKCLAKNPEERYQSAADLAADLRVLRSPSSSTSHGYIPAPPKSRSRMLAAGTVVMLIIAVSVVGAIWRPFGSGTNEAVAARKMLVVLPFENLGAPDQEYFADGMTEEITAHVSKLAGLGVISRTSAVFYKGQNKPLREIGQELGVEYVLEGTIRWDRSVTPPQVRITPQLIRVNDDTHLWAETYERTLHDVFVIQDDIAEHVAEALNLSLVPTHSQAQPTENLKAYDFYLRGKQNLANFDLQAAIRMFEQAIMLDPAFAEPYAGISLAHSISYNDKNLGSDAVRVSARRAIDQALALKPDLPDAHFALGHYYNWCERNYDQAVKEYTRAEELGYKDGDVYCGIGVVQMRQGRWDDAIKNLNIAVALDPRRIQNLDFLIQANMGMHRYDEAGKWCDRWLALEPKSPTAHQMRAWLCLLGYGDLACARRIVNLSPDEEHLLTLSTDRRNLAFFHDALWRFQLTEITPRGLELLHSSWGSEEYLTWSLFGIAQFYDLAGNADSAQFYYDSVAVLLRQATELHPGDSHTQSALGLVCALAGHKDDAIKYASLGRETMTIESCHW